MSETCICPMKGTREVPYLGDLNAEIVLVSESPKPVELKNRQLFSGDIGKLLREFLEESGLNMNKMFMVSAARCHIDKDSLPAREIKEILSCCRPNIVAVMQEIKPKLIVCFGAMAMEQILGMKGMKDKRGSFFHSNEFNCEVFVTWNPAYILRNPSEEANFKMDIEKIASFARSNYQTSQVDFDFEEVQTIRPYLDGEMYRDRSGVLTTALDTETQGTKWYDHNSITLSYSLAISKHKGVNVVLYEETQIGEQSDFNIEIYRGGTQKAPTKATIGVKKSANFDSKIAELKELCERTDIKKYFMNRKYDEHRIRNFGIDLQNAPMDISLAAHVLDSELFLEPSLKQIVESFTNIQATGKDTISQSEKEDMIKLLQTDRQKFTKYACYDAVYTLNAALSVKERLSGDMKSLNYYVNCVHPVESEFLFALECNGALIDQTAVPDVSREIHQKMDAAIAKFLSVCPEPVKEVHKGNMKLSRRMIIMDALFNYELPDGSARDIGYHIRPIKTSSKSKLPVCDKDILSQVIDSPDAPEKAKEMIEAYNEWSLYHTLITRYVPQILEAVGPDGRVHPNYSTTFTSSGRTGARNPSVQNLPKRSEVAPLIRKLFKAPDGKVLLEVDMSMSELRWIAHVADEPTMKEIFRTGKDMHKITGLEVSHREEADLTPKELKDIRSKAKAVNFGFVFGMREKGFKNYARSQYKMKLSDKETKDYRAAFFNLYGGLLSWHERTKEEINRNGYIRTPLGRKRTLTNVYSQDSDKRYEAERIGINVIIQNPSSDYVLLGGNEILKDKRVNPGECRPILFTHDSIAFEVDEDKVLYYDRIIKEHLSNVDLSAFDVTLSVPMVAESEMGKNLGSMTPIKEN